MKSKVLNISFDKEASKSSYDIVIGTNLISNPAPYLKNYIEKRKIIIIHDDYFSPIQKKNSYFYKFLEAIKENCNNVHLISIPGGDKTKNINHLNEIIETTLSFEIDRDSIIIAFGGGVVGDIAGFVSSIVLRLSLIHI